ncbi:MAG: SusC/RagA family TonB-linked outer membrane protein [Bacteroidota bacterium]
MNKLYKWKGILIGMVFAAAGHVMGQTPTHNSADTAKADKPALLPGRLFNNTVMNSTGATSTISGETSYQTPTPNITNTLYGRLSGLTVGQRSGEPSPNGDNAQLGVRGIGSYGIINGNGFNAPKYYVDGFEVNLDYVSYLAAAEIESITVLKDAAALATLGMRGSNGAIWIVTKRGKAGKTTFQFQARTGLQSAIDINKPLDAFGYATLYNQAVSNDNGNIWTPKYTTTQLQAYQNGTGTNVDFYKQVLKSRAPYTDGDMMFNGGDANTQYNVVFDYANQQGLYNVSNSDITSNSSLAKYNLRANLDFTISKIFTARVDLGGRVEDRRAPNYVDGSYSTAKIFNDLAGYPSNIYPVYDGATTNFSGTTVYPNNPVGSILGLGFQTNHTRILQGNFGLKEKLDVITPGLYLDEAYSFNSFAFSTYNKTATYGRFIGGVAQTTDKTTTIAAGGLGAQSQEDWRQGMITLGYDHQFGLGHLASAINFHQSDYRGEGTFGYQYHYQNLNGRINYSYNNRYIAEFGFSYFGIDAYRPGNQWGFYPTGSLGWIVSNEDFLKDNKVINFFKLRGSVGKLGGGDSNAANILSGVFSGANGRYLYQQYYAGVAASSPSTGLFYTSSGAATQPGTLRPYFIANPNIFAEQSIKYNLGADITLFKHLSLTLDAFMDKRSGIITLDNSIPADYGLNYYFSNVGKMTSKGLEAGATYSNKFGEVSYTIMGMASLNKNKIDYAAEIPPAYSYNGITGRAYGTPIGLVATGFYQLSDFNADGSLKTGLSVPAFGKVQPGDLKYQDLNNDGKIDQTDVTAIGKPAFPELTYSFGANVNYKGFDLGVFFQGTEGSTVNLMASNLINQTQAFVSNGNAFAIAQGAWAYYPDQGIDTRATATYPRLTATANTNNYRNSSFWIKSGDFLRIRNAELGYTFSSGFNHRLGISKLRVYVNAANPITWSTLQKNYHIDPETQSGYPALKSVNAGLAATF